MSMRRDIEASAPIATSGSRGRKVIAARDASMAAGKPDRAWSWIEIEAYSRRVTLTVSDGGEALFDLLMRRCPTAKVAWRSSHEQARDPSE